MGDRVLDAARLDTVSLIHNPNANETVEMNAVKRIVRESWESEAKKNKGNNNTDILERHANFMNEELGSLGYETMCMQNVVANTKRMSKGEVSAYLHMIEALAIGYKARFGTEFGGLLVAGVTVVSKDTRSMRKNFDYLMNHLSKNSAVLESQIEKEIRRIEKLNYDLGRMETGILRFFRKKDIVALKGRITSKRVRISKFETKRIARRRLSDTLNARALQSPRMR